MLPYATPTAPHPSNPISCCHSFDGAKLSSTTDFTDADAAAIIGFENAKLDNVDASPPVFACDFTAAGQGGVSACCRAVAGQVAQEGIGAGVDATEDASAEAGVEGDIEEGLADLLEGVEDRLLDKVNQAVGNRNEKKLALKGTAPKEPSGLAGLDTHSFAENIESKSARYVNKLMKTTAAKLLAVNDSASGSNAASWFFVFRKAAELEKAARKELKKGPLDPESFQLEATVRQAIMWRPTRYDLNGGLVSTLTKIVTLKPIHMSKDLQQLEYLLEQMQTLNEAILETTWLDIIETWLAVSGWVDRG